MWFWDTYSGKLAECSRLPLGEGLDWWGEIMFWNSTIAGFRVFGFWEFYAAAIAFLAIAFLPKLFFALMAEHYRIFEDARFSIRAAAHSMGSLRHGFRDLIDCVIEGRMAGGLPAAILIGFCELLGVCFFILTLSPIILDLSPHAAWSLPWMLVFNDPLIFLKIIGLIIILTVVLNFIPFIAKLESVNALISGGVVLMFVVRDINQINGVEFLPAFLFGVYVVAAGFAFKWLVMIPIILGLSLLSAGRDDLFNLLLILLAPLFTFLSVFIYGGWLALQIRTRLP